MRLFFALPVAACFWVQTQALNQHELWERDIDDSIPDCAVDCLGTFVQEICGSATNTTCLCTDSLTTALEPCVIASCNITEALRMEGYSKKSCGFSDNHRADAQMQLFYVIPFLVFVFVALRIFGRVKQHTGRLADHDWMIIAAFVSFLCLTWSGVEISLNGFGKHTYFLNAIQVSEGLKYFYISEIFHLVGITLTKLSLLLFFRNVFPGKRFKMATWIVGGVIAASNLSLLLAFIFQCVRFISKLSAPRLTQSRAHLTRTGQIGCIKSRPSKCIDGFAVLMVAAVMSLFHSVIIILLPIPILWGLQLNWQKRANMIFMFTVGNFVIVCSIFKLPTLMKMHNTRDPSYDQSPITLWTALEISIGITCACLPACRSLLGHFFPNLRMMSDSSGGGLTPAYPRQSMGQSRVSRNRTESLTRTFIELDGGTTTSNTNDDMELDRRTVGSKCPLAEKLTPCKGNGYSFQTVNESKDAAEDEELECGGMMMTRTPDQRRSSHDEV
ncbi:hypothetical protein LSUE1_G001302 [Lachnellula suecica]|uniref:Extracellular membrane protein CFEM domain-containing protein n=1 Tax=Lachnellula suecica TaxID=602035 RepID=A0A8T9CGX3_9HELO|nr:hypothetical protein LSUE1_G001302 [Lachnellula suecica]